MIDLNKILWELYCYEVDGPPQPEVYRTDRLKETAIWGHSLSVETNPKPVRWLLKRLDAIKALDFACAPGYGSLTPRELRGCIYASVVYDGNYKSLASKINRSYTLLMSAAVEGRRRFAAELQRRQDDDDENRVPASLAREKP